MNRILLLSAPRIAVDVMLLVPANPRDGLLRQLFHGPHTHA